MQFDMTAQLMPMFWTLVALMVVSGVSLFGAHSH